jgi:hypothetical protein
MRRALLAAAALIACRGSAPRPPPRVTGFAIVRQVQVGWMQLATGQLNKPPVEDLRHGRAPDEVEAGEIAQTVLDKCKKGVSIEALQTQYSEVAAETIAIEAESRLPFRDLALSLQPGECALMRSNYALHVIKRVE